MVLFEELLPGGSMWSHVLKRGTALRLTDREGGANAGALFYNFENFAERLNLPDTLKAQHIARLTAGNVLYSDMGRILCSITEDTAGWHDPLGGWSTADSVRAQYGALGYQEHRNDCVKNGRDSFLTELMKYGMEERDLVPCVNFFSKVSVQRDGSMEWTAVSKAGDFVELRAEMNTLVVLHACPHPMDMGTKWAPKPVHLTVKRVAAPGPEDPCRKSRPENERGFILTERYFL